MSIEVKGKGCQVKIIADSISEQGKRITTLQLRYWRAIHAEFMTHRVFSRNASSSRAIPVAKILGQVRNDPSGPIHWGKNQAGMQAREELIGLDLYHVQGAWHEAAREACRLAECMNAIGAHKQIVNRLLEPFQYISSVVTATEWDNFFELRCHEDAQPEINDLACSIRSAMNTSVPDHLEYGEWHLPYVGSDDWGLLSERCNSIEEMSELARKISAARCCRVSYLKHDGTSASIEEDLELCNKLVGARPLHASPFEHQATPDEFLKEGKFGGTDHWEKRWLHGNFVGWIQNRKLIENQA